MNKKPERGYIICFIMLLLLIGTIIYALWFQHYITGINYEIESLNYELAENMAYNQVPQVAVDMSIYNWIISAESAAFSIVTANQFRKKMRNNNAEYMELYLDKWMADPELRPYASQMAQTWLSTNSN